ncbi:MarR family transcriptional regulator [Rhodosalinus sp. FB01]|uniref:MarR family transcriptional regulator n=1 Tax=Rhodosalinus sp. FB01 TaxID=3239194 RepID=UPI003525C77F
MCDKAVKASKTERSADILAERFAEEYPRYQYAVVEFMVAHLTDVSRAFHGDLQQALVLAVIGQVRLGAGRTARDAEQVQPAAEELSITASRIADVTGIPRETVRRKLKLLQDRGWVDRRADGAWYLVSGADTDTTTPARRDFAELEERTRRILTRLVVDLGQLARPPRR